MVFNIIKSKRLNFTFSFVTFKNIGWYFSVWTKTNLYWIPLNPLRNRVDTQF